MDFLYNLNNEDQGNILDNNDTSSGERKSKEGDLMVSIPPSDKNLEESTPSSQDRQQLKRTKGPTNSLGTAIDQNYMKIVFHLFQIVLEVK